MSETLHSKSPLPNTSDPKIGLALGGGGARGLAHIPMLEVFDELGIKPAVIAGSSIGALAAAGYASGLTGSDIRVHALEALKSRREIAKRLVGKRAGDFFKLLEFSSRTTARIDGMHLLDLFLPPGVNEDFSELKIPLIVVATDYYARKEKIFETGPLRKALSASIALPGLFAPCHADGRLLIDGGIVNPLPFDKLMSRADHIIAIDVTGGPVENVDRPPNNADLVFRSSQIMQRQITKARLQLMPIDILIAPDVDRFRVLEFHKVKEILAASEPAKDEFKRKLEVLMEAIIA